MSIIIFCFVTFNESFISIHISVGVLNIYYITYYLILYISTMLIVNSCMYIFSDDVLKYLMTMQKCQAMAYYYALHKFYPGITYCFFASVLGNASRDKVRRYLKVKFTNISDAEEAYSINYFHDDELFGIQHEVASTPTSSNQVPAVHASPTLAFSPLKHAEERNLPGSVLDVVSSGFVELTKRQHQQLMVNLFHKWLKLDVHQKLNANYVSLDFLPLLSKVLKVLLVKGKKQCPL